MQRSLRHQASREFWEAYDNLSPSVQRLADKNFAILKEDPRHPSLHLKQVGRFWSVRIGLHTRALGVAVPDGVLWFWIGSHAEYDLLLGRVR